MSFKADLKMYHVRWLYRSMHHFTDYTYTLLVCLLLFVCNYVFSFCRGFPLPLGAWDGLRYFIVALPEPSI